jgi:hypothetical protein
MRTPALVLLLVLAAAAPAGAGLSKSDAGDGTITIEGARGTVILQAKGAVIGRLDSGTLEITDLTPNDLNGPVVVGKGKVRLRGSTHVWRGQSLSFRLSGLYRLVVRGTGIDLSAVGRGFAQLKGDTPFVSGLYSTTGAECSRSPERCLPFPERLTRLELGERERAADRDEREENNRKSGGPVLLAP